MKRSLWLDGNGSGSPRILLVIDCLEVGGAQQHLLTVARGLTRAGFELVVATSGREPLAHEFRRAGIPVLSLTRRSIKHRLSPTFVARLSWLAVHGCFDLIHAHLHSASVAAAVGARISGLPLVLTGHSMNTWAPAHHRRLARWANRQATAVIAVSDNIAAMVAAGGVRAQIIPNGTAIPELTVSAASAIALRVTLGLPASAYVIGYVGRFTPDKNPLLFVNVAALVAARCPNAQFLLIGDGPLRQVAEARGRQLGIADRLHFLGFQPNAVELQPAADVLALTSNSEGSPLVVLEAMAAGRPVVATAVGYVPHQVVDGLTGFVVPARDATALADRLVRLADPRLRRELGRAGRERVRSNFSAQQQLQEIVRVYGEALGAGHQIGASLTRDRALSPSVNAPTPIPSGQDGLVVPNRLAHHAANGKPAMHSLATLPTKPRP
ncbi:MAG: glycosyltransferase [Chloroflexi bacterium]|nr:glycosyltransferase [Chloroflexota bacterium]